MINEILEKKYRNFLTPSENIRVSLTQDAQVFLLKASIGDAKKVHEFDLGTEEAGHDLLIRALA